MDFRYRLARQNANFDGADEFLFVRRRDFLGRFRVKPLEDTMQMAGRMLFGTGTEALAQFFRALRNVCTTFEERAQIQSCADGKYRQVSAFAQVFQNLQGELPVASSRGIVPWPKNVDQMMRNATAFGEAGLCRANIKAAIELRRIARYNLPAEPLRECHAQRRLSRSRRTNNGTERQELFVFAHRHRGSCARPGR